MAKIKGGATLWARQTIDSEIFFDKPDKWFKIWFYIVSQVNHQDNHKYKRGEGFMQQKIICEYTKATPDQVKKCFSWLKKMKMISTTKSTRGMVVKVLKYNDYQSLDTYKKHQDRHFKSTTINKNVNNVNTIYTHWLKQNIIQHKKNIYDSQIKTALQTYSVDEIIIAITNYAIILHGEEYYWSYKWTLGEFLKRGIEKFIDLNVAKNNYLQNKTDKQKEEQSQYVELR